jgi:hypothetical protein
MGLWVYTGMPDIFSDLGWISEVCAVGNGCALMAGWSVDLGF